MDDVLDIRGLSRRFGETLANDDITLSVARGTVLGLLGHNGAGKTTLVSQIAGLLRPDSGSIRVAGIDAHAAPARARRHLALQPQGQAPIDGLTVRTAIELSARVRGAPPAAARAAADQLGEELDITPWLDHRALPDGRGISGGIRRLTTFAMTIASPTALLILDEPSNDVDAARRSLLWEALRRRADAGAGSCSSHTTSRRPNGSLTTWPCCRLGAWLPKDRRSRCAAPRGRTCVWTSSSRRMPPTSTYSPSRGPGRRGPSGAPVRLPPHHTQRTAHIAADQRRRCCRRRQLGLRLARGKSD
ncbi:MAG: ATP-binding cassette domain-containing protein [Cumulibacter sp.]